MFSPWGISKSYEKQRDRGDCIPITAHLLTPVALLTPVTLQKRGGGLMKLSPSPEAMCPCLHPHTHLLTRSPSLPQLASPAWHPWDARLAWLPWLPRWPLWAPLAHSPACGALRTRGTLVPFVTFGSSLTREA